MASAAITHYIVRLCLHEMLVPPVGEVLTHPVAEVIAESLVPLGYFALGGYRLKWLGIALLVGGVIAFVLWVTGTPPWAMILYGLLAGVTWGGAGLLLVGVLYAAWSEAKTRRLMDEADKSRVASEIAEQLEQGYAVPTGVHIDLDDLYDSEEVHQGWKMVILGVSLYVILCGMGTVLVFIVFKNVYHFVAFQSGLIAASAAAVAVAAPFVTFAIAGIIQKIKYNSDYYNVTAMPRSPAFVHPVGSHLHDDSAGFLDMLVPAGLLVLWLLWAIYIIINVK